MTEYFSHVVDNYINGNLKDSFYLYSKIKKTSTFWVFVENNYGSDIKNKLMNYFSKKENGE